MIGQDSKAINCNKDNRTRVTVKNDDNGNQKTETRRSLGQISMSIGNGHQVEPLPQGGREQLSLK
jgi:hypothetical protein